MKRLAILMFSLLTLATVLCFAATITVNAWTRQGDEVLFLAPSEWGFGRGCWDGVRGAGGDIYKYGFFQRWTGVHPRQRP